MKYLLVILIAFLSFASCEKDENSPAKVAANTPAQGLKVDVYSNFKYPHLSIGYDTTELKRFNAVPYTDEGPLHYELVNMPSGFWQIITNSTKNSIDTTLHMLDNGLVWNRLVVTINDSIVFDQTDTAGPSPGGFAQNVYQFNYPQ
jgi:hypothetical protein